MTCASAFRARRSTTLLLGALALLGSVRAGHAQETAPSEHTVSVNGTARRYDVYIPSKAPRPAPVVFLFHGGGGRPEAIARVTGMTDLADKNGFVVVYPSGALPDKGPRGSWNIGSPQSTSSADDVSFVKEMLRDLGQTVAIDPARVYATGMSMGGIFSYRLACELSDTFAAIAPVAATMVEPSCHPSSPVAVLHIHGSDDDRIPLNGGRGQMTSAERSWPAPKEGVTSWSQLDGCSGPATVKEDGAADCTSYGQCRAPVEYCVVEGGGHAWPDGASERIWAFFAAHPKQAR